MTSGLVRELASDAVDIIGDVHGEIDALVALLARLGCDAERGTVERKIVFVGDLVDRGPDSGQVIQIVQRLVEAGNAQVVLGNHELNILLEHEKEGNGWIMGHTDRWWSKGQHIPFASRSVEAEERERIVAFLRSLPVALESSKLRIVHAAWEPEAIERARQCSGLEELMKPQEVDLTGIDLTGAPTSESLRRPEPPVEFHAGLAEKHTREQISQPVKVLTSGLERPIPEGQSPRFLSGKWRLVERNPWWDADTDERAVVFGHYWRHRAGSHGVGGKADPFEGIAPTHWFGRKQQAFCVDYSVGLRFKPRHFGENFRDDHGLAALRWPERLLFYDDEAAPVQT